jgi:hypothetical protein
MTPDGVVATDSSRPVVLSVRVGVDGTRISVETGRIELRSGNNRRVLAAGETFSTLCDSWTVPIPQQNLNKSQKAGIIAGVGAGVAILLFAIIGRESNQQDNFGGCVIILSPIEGGPARCN